MIRKSAIIMKIDKPRGIATMTRKSLIRFNWGFNPKTKRGDLAHSHFSYKRKT